MSMYAHYLKTARRSLGRDRTYTILNILGLAAGMTGVLLISVFIRDEWRYDRYHEKADRIFRVVDSMRRPGGEIMNMALSSAAFAPRFEMEFPEVEATVRLMPRRRMVQLREERFYEEGFFYADPSIFKIFSFQTVRGNLDTALDTPDGVVLSRSVSVRYFGRENPIGQALLVEGAEFRVTGVMEDMPRTSHFRADIIASMRNLESIPGLRERYFESWARHEFYTYILVREGMDPQDLQEALPAFIERYAAEEIKRVLGGTMSSRLQPLNRIWLHSRLPHEIRPTSDIKYVTIFGLIGIFVLIIACTNYINLATARSVSRLREVGMRRVLGATRRQLACQFMGESLLVSFCALILTLGMTAAAWPLFNRLTGRSLDVSVMGEPWFLGSALVLFWLVGLSAGGYPAFHISRRLPITTVRRTTASGPGGRNLRRILVGVQFAISMTLIICSGVVFEQLDYLRNRKLGFDKQHVALVPVRSSRMRRDFETVKTELAACPGVIGSTLTIGTPGGIAAGDAIRLLTGEGPVTLTLSMIYTDHDYIPVMGMEIIQGRNFSRDVATDPGEAFIINETAVRALGLKNPLQTRFEWGEPGDPFFKRGRVIGVVRDFAFRSLKDDIQPFVIHIHPPNTFIFAVRIQPSRISETMPAIEAIWREWDPRHPFEYSFLDESFDRLYRGEDRLARIFRILTVLGMGIAVLGLFGLTMFTVRRRTREIGIRKVLGASGKRIFRLILWDFARLVLFSGLVAWPVSYWLMRAWLHGFAYRTGPGIKVFFLSLGLVLIATLLTVSWQSLRAALANPADSLRYE